jgi:hypothetical protein
MRHCATPAALRPQQARPPHGLAPHADPHDARAAAGRWLTGAGYLPGPRQYLAITEQAQVVVTQKRTALLFTPYGSHRGPFLPRTPLRPPWHAEGPPLGGLCL